MKTRTIGAAVAALALVLGGTLLTAAPAMAEGGNDDKPAKVTICHKAGETLEVAAAAVPAHLDHGDTLGACAPVEPTPEPEPEVPAFVPYNESARWIIPATWPAEQTPSYQPGIFPQDRLVTELPCGRWSQDDTYLIESPAEVEIYAALGDVLTQGEDSAIYLSHVFTYGGDCAPDPEPVIEQHEASECASTTSYTTRTWTTTDGVVSNEASTTRALDRAEAIALACYTPPAVECEPGTAPGWLNEHGDPTSCVGDNPCPEVEFGQPCPGDVPPVIEPPVDTPPTEVVPVTDLAPIKALAHTGANEGATLAGLGVGGLSLASGIALIIAAALRRRASLEV